MDIEKETDKKKVLTDQRIKMPQCCECYIVVATRVPHLKNKILDIESVLEREIPRMHEEKKIGRVEFISGE